MCQSVNDLGQTIKVSCGTWTTYFAEVVHRAGQSYCEGLPPEATVQAYSGGNGNGTTQGGSSG